jgi:hypothetical protein
MKRSNLHLQLRQNPLCVDAGLVILSIAMLASLGCAQLPMSVGEPATAARPDSNKGCHWIALTQAGRASLSEGDLALAADQYRSAFDCTSTLSRRDARVRTSLGHLVAVAAAYHHEGNDDAAESTMQSVHEAASSRGLHGSTMETLDVRFEELAGPKQRYIRYQMPSRGMRAPNRRGFDRMILNAAKEFDVDPALVKAVVAAESNFDERAVSPVGAQGLMQLMPETARAMGVDWPFDPTENLKGGVQYLRAMLDRFGNTRYALAAYNAGPEAVDRHGGIPPYRETQEYVRRVLSFYASYRAETLDPALADSGS